MSSGDRWSDFVQGAGLLGGIYIDTIKARKKKLTSKKSSAMYFLLSKSRTRR